MNFLQILSKEPQDPSGKRTAGGSATLRSLLVCLRRRITIRSAGTTVLTDRVLLSSNNSRLMSEMKPTPIMRPILFLAFIALPLGAQAAATSPYAGQESRSIKSLSPTEQADLIAGKGMGFAKAAELNGYPGPAHVLELASKLELTNEQRTRTEALFKDMESKAKALGAKLIEAERSLDALFSTKQISHENLTKTLAEIGSLQAQLRAVHLGAHLDQASILTPHQIVMYNQLRGYYGERKHNGDAHQHKH